jgi:hypothetical protein
LEVGVEYEYIFEVTTKPEDSGINRLQYVEAATVRRAWREITRMLTDSSLAQEMRDSVVSISLVGMSDSVVVEIPVPA